MTLVYRIEGPDGFGPWQSTAAPYKEFILPYGRDKVWHPVPDKDPGLAEYWANLKSHGWHRSHSFGFSSLSQLRRWFHSEQWIVDLHYAGFVVKVYDANDAHHGDHQSIFKKPLSTVVQEISLLSSRVLGA